MHAHPVPLPASHELPSAGRPEAAAQAGSESMPITVESSDILQGARAIAIRHNGALYRLQSTKLGKLILTK
jgi:hemin uptake protein HemP